MENFSFMEVFSSHGNFFHTECKVGKKLPRKPPKTLCNLAELYFFFQLMGRGRMGRCKGKKKKKKKGKINISIGQRNPVSVQLNRSLAVCPFNRFNNVDRVCSSLIKTCRKTNLLWLSK